LFPSASWAAWALVVVLHDENELAGHDLHSAGLRILQTAPILFGLGAFGKRFLSARAARSRRFG
jgi:hypothetical protein